MSNIETSMERIAKNVGCGTTALRGRMELILSEQKTTWSESGKDEEQCTLLALRVAGRQIKSENDKVKRSGCTNFEGMFLTSPRYKDWAEMSYKKMATTLSSGDENIRNALVEQGKIVVFEYDPETDGYTKHSNASLDRKDDFVAGRHETNVSVLPKEAVEIDSNTHYYLVWNATTPLFPSGDKNFKYGAARPQSEKERTCLFFGRKQGSSDWSTWTFRFSGELANNAWPTYTPGSIGMRPARNGSTAYGKLKVSNFVADDSLTESFPADPMAIVKQEATEWLEKGLQDLDAYYAAHNGDKDWWDQWVATSTEVVHIDPREKGGYIITVGDSDIESMAPTVDIYVDEKEGDSINFGVGSELLIVGAPWQNRDGEMQLSITGWWCIDSLSPVEVGGWD